MPEELDILPTGEVRADGVRVGVISWDSASARMDVQGVFHAGVPEDAQSEMDGLVSDLETAEGQIEEFKDAAADAIECLKGVDTDAAQDAIRALREAA